MKKKSNNLEMKCSYTYMMIKLNILSYYLFQVFIAAVVDKKFKVKIFGKVNSSVIRGI